MNSLDMLTTTPHYLYNKCTERVSSFCVFVLDVQVLKKMDNVLCHLISKCFTIF